MSPTKTTQKRSPCKLAMLGSVVLEIRLFVRLPIYLPKLHNLPRPQAHYMQSTLTPYQSRHMESAGDRQQLHVTCYAVHLQLAAVSNHMCSYGHMSRFIDSRSSRKADTPPQGEIEQLEEAAKSPLTAACGTKGHIPRTHARGERKPAGARLSGRSV